MYVEGEEDVLFWDHLITLFSDKTVRVEEVGGKDEVKKYARKLQSDDIDCLVAIDADYICYEEQFKHDRILTTYGYSIENSILTSSIIREVVHNVGKIPYSDFSENECRDWFDLLYDTLEPLLIHDVYNKKNDLGELVLGNNCARFLKTSTSHDLCENKIENFIDKLPFSVSQSDIDEIIDDFTKFGRILKDFIRGHFLFSAVLRYVNTTVNRIRKTTMISKDFIYGAVMLAFRFKFDDSHPHYEYYERSISSI